MNVDFSTPILDLFGRPVVEVGSKITLATVACGALLAQVPGDENLTGLEKANRFKLALKAAEGNAQEVSNNEVNTLKEVVAKVYSPLVVGRVFEILGGEEAAVAQSDPLS